jgi:CheY-like chemotaxis protein
MKRTTMLYVEDEEDDVFFMRRAVKAAGGDLELQSASDVPSAIAYLQGREVYADRETYPFPDLILLDLNLPTVSGFELLEWVREQPEFNRLPVVIYSSSGREEDRERAGSLGANDYLTKPSSGADFLKVVRLILERWISRRPLLSPKKT